MICIMAVLLVFSYNAVMRSVLCVINSLYQNRNGRGRQRSIEARDRSLFRVLFNLFKFHAISMWNSSIGVCIG